MWEAISGNQKRSWILIAALGGLLVLVGWSVGMSVDPAGGAAGVAAALFLWLVLLLLALFAGDSILLLSAGARKIAKDDAPQLWNVVEEMTIASGLGRMPDVYVIDDALPNAFAVGRKKENAAVAVTSGLLGRLNRDELQGVVAHEIGHIVNRDVLFLTFAAVLVGSIVMLSDFLVRYLWYGGGRRRGSSRGGKGQGVALLIGLLVAILAPLFARLLYFACSRRREYLADASAALFTRYPEGLASALGKMSSVAVSAREVNRALVPLYIVNPLTPRGGGTLFSTHPPTAMRIEVLRAMAGAGYRDYEAAYRQVFKEGCIGTRTLAAGAQSAAIRAPSAEPETSEAAVERARGAGDLIDRLSGFLAMRCTCGVGIKLPPGSDLASVPCPRCGRDNAAPVAVPARAETGAGAALAPEALGPLVFKRRGRSWETFKCTCGRVIQLSPSHSAPMLRCARCRRSIEIVSDRELVS